MADEREILEHIRDVMVETNRQRAQQTRAIVAALKAHANCADGPLNSVQIDREFAAAERIAAGEEVDHG